MKFYRILGASLSIATAALLVSCSSDSGDADGGSEDPIKIGAVLAITGPGAAFGVPEQNAAEVAIDYLNDNGGVDGRELELVVMDSQTDPTEAARAAQRLISDENVLAIVGASTGSETLALAPIAAQNGVPVLAPNGTIGLTDPEEDFFPYVFRTSVSDELTIPLLLDRAVEEGASRVAIFSQEDALGSFSAELLEKLAAERDDVEIVESVAVPLDATDVSAAVSRVANAKPDAIVMPLSSVGVAGAVLRTANETGLDIPMYGALATANDAVIEVAGEEATKNLIVANMIDPSNLTDAQKELHERIRAAGNEPAGGFVDLFGANSVQVIGEALRNADEISSEGLKNALESGTKFDSWAIEPYSFSTKSHDGLTADALVWTTVRDGKFVNVDAAE